MNNAQNRYRGRGVLALIALTFSFGVIAITARYLSFYLALYQQLYLTTGTGFIFSLVLFRHMKIKDKINVVPFKDWMIIGVRAIVGYLAAGALYRQSIILTKISNVTFIQSLPFAGFFGWLLLREKFTLKKLGWLMAAFIGVLMIAVKDYSAIFQIGKGELFSFISAALFSFGYIARKWQTDVLEDKEITQILLFFSTVILVLASTVRGEGWPHLPMPTGVYITMAINGFLNAVIIYFINYGFKRVEAVLASNILTLESVFVLILAIIFFREIPNVKEFIGGLIIIGSAIGMNKEK